MKRMLHNEPGIWTHRDVRLILPARTVALAGNSMAMVTLLLQAHDRGAGTAGVAALLICLALPTITLMAVTGRLADTRDSRTLLSAGIAVQIAALVLLALSHGLAVTLAGAALFETGQAVIGPVWSGLLPRVVGEGSVGRAIAWQQGLGAVAAPIGAAVGGIVYGSAGAGPALLGAAGAFALLWCAALAIRTRRHITAEQRTVQDDDAAPPAPSSRWAGVAILRHDAVVWPTILALLPMVVVVEGVNAVEVFLARDVLGATPSQYGLGELAAGIGGVIGAAAAGRLAATLARSRATVYGFAAACAGVALAGGAPSFWVYLGISSLIAAAAGVANAANGALVITRTPDAHRGAVGAALSGLSRTGSVIALALGGLVGTLVSPRTVFIVGGVFGMVVVLALGWRAVRAARREAVPAEVPA